MQQGKAAVDGGLLLWRRDAVFSELVQIKMAKKRKIG